MNISTVSHQCAASHRPSTIHTPSRSPHFPTNCILPPVLDHEWDERATLRFRAHTPLGWRDDYPDVEKVLNSHFQ